MKKAIYRLETYLKNNATESEKDFLVYLLNHTREAVDKDIHTLAKESYCSPATIIRICKKNGFKGFKEMKKALLNDIHFSNELVEAKVNPLKHSDFQKGITEVFNNNIEAIKNTYALMDFKELEEITQLIIKSKKVILFGIGASFIVAKDFQQKLERVNKPNVLFEDFHMQLISANNAQAEDVAIIISYSGLTKEISRIAETMKKNKTPIIAITKYGSSKLISLSDYNLYVADTEGLLRVGASASRITQLTVVDALFQSYLRKTKDISMDKVLKTNQLLSKE